MAKKKTAKRDACYNKVKSRYKKWPSAYASGALVRCRKVGAKNWGTGGKKKKTLTKRQQDTLKKHSAHHSPKHMAMMRAEMRKGVSFTAAHKKAQKKVGK